MNPLQPLLQQLASEFQFENLFKGSLFGETRNQANIVAPEVAQVPILAALGYSRMAARHPSPVIAVVPTSTAAEFLASELTVWLGENNVERFVAWETFPFEKVSPTFQSMGERLRILWRLRTPGQAPAVVVVPLGALTQRLVPDSLKVVPIQVQVGQAFDRDKLVEQLIKGGYRRCPQVEHCGNIAVRGSIVDVYGSNAAHPVRLDFWGDTIERLTEFSLSDQRSVADITSVEFFPCRELLPTKQVRQRATQLQADAPWASSWWQQLEREEMFDGMESYLPWLIDEELVLGDVLADESLVVCVDAKWLAGRAKEIQKEESELVTAFAEAWIGSSPDNPEALSQSLPSPLHVSYERALEKFSGAQVALMASAVRKKTGAVTTQKIKARSWPQLSPGLRVAGPFPSLGDLLEEGYGVTVTADNPNSAARIAEQLGDHNIHLPVMEASDGEASGVVTAALQQGFILDDLKLAVLTESEITGKKRQRTLPRKPPRGTGKTKRGASAQARAGQNNSANATKAAGPARVPSAAGAASSAAATSPVEILRASIPFEIGSYVVHRRHGIARYGGIKTHEIQGVLTDYLLLEYRGKDKLFVPIEQLDAIKPYTGGETPKLSRMGGSDWQRTTSKARAAAAEVADELVALYQHRQINDGFAFPADNVWQNELESSFPYEETPDQLHAIQTVKYDMESPAPMDRLVCGDVGFGKTEVAIRAAFKAVNADKQVALLVPTTLLAQQHFETFRERFGSFPVRMELLSRFVSSAKARSILQGLASGDVQLVIGTHRLLSKDVKFHDLGLLILDEEQRFGVKHKERIKTLRTNVDVLTMTATPIPRTLELSLTEIRDLSIIQTPPQDRQPIFTYVGSYDERAVAEAIKRELLREGQVFYVHNHVLSIEAKAEDLRRLVPEARFVVAHGQMDGAQLEEVVNSFVDKHYDVLVCTTIIESGTDIASVNTLIVENAHRFGLAQLHQLRGRVGRSHQRAYAYLFTPADMSLSQEAYERLKTIEEHTELGAGSLVAMRDLELRGAGNLLGVGQSGHIAAVGYDLYCQLVSEKVAELKGETPKQALEVELDLLRQSHLPSDYISHEATRLEAYRNVAAVRTEAEADDLAAQWRDRFGELPPEALALLDVARLRAECFKHEISKVKVRRNPRARQLEAQISPIELPLSKVARLERLFGGSTLDESSHTLNLVLSSETTAATEILHALRELMPDPEMSDMAK